MLAPSERQRERGVERVDIAIIGAGLSGLAAAVTLAERGVSTCILERHRRPGLDTSTHNSGVIHTGIYYPPGTLKARLSLEGRELLYAFAEAQDIPHERCGKLIVASSSEEIAVLETLRLRALANGVDQVSIVDRRFIERREPAIRAEAALFTPHAGIVDTEALVRTLLRVAQAHGAIFLPASRLIGVDRDRDSLALQTEREAIGARVVVNAAGLYADDVSALLGGERFSIHPCRGEYAELVPSKRGLVNGLVYPLPHANGHGLGVHLTRTISGAVWLGPTARYQDRKDDYENNRLPVSAFLEPARALLPQLTLEDLRLAGSGIRPKLHPATESFSDFLIRRDRENPAVIQVAGIESPGLTSCLAIGRFVGHIADDLL
jgi:L-2-hydroxyglutarate oxidase LhgO